MRRARPTREYRMGRRARSVEATRAAIIDAALELGDPRVPLAAVASRSGVSQRTILRHFGDRNGLLVAAMDAGNQRVREQRFSVPAGDIDAAATDLVRHYEDLGDQVINQLAEEGQDARVDQVLDSGRQLHRQWVEKIFDPLLAGLNRRTRRRRIAQLVAVCDVYTWKLLRRDAGLGISETETAIAELIRGLTEGESR